MLRFLCVLLLILPNLAAAAPPVILSMGDSLSAGYGLRQEQAWPALLADRLQREKLDYAVINASISGETSGGGRSRFPDALRKHHPAVVILELGANDGLRGLPLDTMKANLGAMVEASQAAGARVLLLGMNLPPNFGPDYTIAFSQVYGDLAKSRKTGFVPFFLDAFAWDRDMFQPDGLHPVAKAQPLILESIWPALKPLLRKP